MAVLTNGGLTLWATALQTAGANTAITYVEVSTGMGTLTAALVSGTAYTSITLAAGIPNAIANGQSLTLIDSTGDTQVITGTGNSPGDTVIAVSSFTANANYAIGSGVVTTPAATDTQLYAQSTAYRIGATPGVAGAAAGESLNTGYFDPTTPTATYLEVGYWGGSTATSSAGTGTLLARDVQFWSHTNNVDSASFQLDSTL
ncbi:MAG: hypothetical protein KGH75_00690 [Rhodospirillales bacterium]|nr:hypothetical protein [Rhodospirillales bacterium]